MYTDSSTEDMTNIVSWSSSTTSVATISNADGSRGLATTAGEGQTIITATHPETAISGSTNLTVVPPGAVGWSQTINPLSPSQAYAVAVQGPYIYIGGYNETATDCFGVPCSQWRIEKRNASNGSLVNGFGTGGVLTTTATSEFDYIAAMTTDDTYLYAVGIDEHYGWRIDKRNLSDGALDVTFGTQYSSPPLDSFDSANAVAKDSSSLYVAGYRDDGIDQMWLIEKRDINTGALVPAFDTDGVVTSAGGGGSNQAYAIALDPENNAMYIAGFDASGWRIEKRRLDTGALVTDFSGGGVGHSVAGSANALATDGNYLYIVGQEEISFAYTRLRIEKRSLVDGSLVSSSTDGPASGNDALYAIAVDAPYFYVTGYAKNPSTDGNYDWYVEKRALDTLGRETAFGTNGVVKRDLSTGGDDTSYAIAVDPADPFIYVSGYDSDPGYSEWRIEKIAK
jgi:hypothetical protein